MQIRFLTRGVLATALFAALCVLGGCNTVQGLGKDIEKAGEKTQDAANSVRRKL